MQEHGVRGLYRGLPPLVYFSIPKVAVRFFLYEAIRNSLADEHGHLSPGRTFLAGLIAGAGEGFVAVAPMETLKVKFIHDATAGKPRFQGFVHGIKTIIREQGGLSSIYQGLERLEHSPISSSSSTPSL